MKAEGHGGYFLVRGGYPDGLCRVGGSAAGADMECSARLAQRGIESENRVAGSGKRHFGSVSESFVPPKRLYASPLPGGATVERA